MGVEVDGPGSDSYIVQHVQVLKYQECFSIRAGYNQCHDILKEGSNHLDEGNDVNLNIWRILNNISKLSSL